MSAVSHAVCSHSGDIGESVMIMTCRVAATLLRSRSLLVQHTAIRRLAFARDNTMTLDNNNCTDEIKLDRDSFRKQVKIPFITLEKKSMARILPFLNSFLFKSIKLNPVLEDEAFPDHKNILLNPNKVKEIQDLGEEVLRRMRDHNNPVELKERNIELTYDNMSVDAVMKAALPPEAGPLTSFSIIGHIIHLNLRDNHLPYKKLIGQVLLDKNKPRVKMVVNKVAGIETEFRNFQMEVLAKDADDVSTLVQVSQGNCTFKFDFAHVYWNPRLDTEHDRILSRLRKGMDVLYDVFAGVGPFSIPAAKKKCKAVANDLNPESFQWMQENARMNKVSDLHQCFNLDGRDFIRNIIKKDLIKEWKDFSSRQETRVKKFHIVMNLPGLAVEFLDCFVGWMKDEEEEIRSLSDYNPEQMLPIIHVYTFVRGDDKEENKKQVVKSIEQVLNISDLSSSSIEEVFFVRKVSVNKDMFRVSLSLPESVIFDSRQRKKLKVDGSEGGEEGRS